MPQDYEVHAGDSVGSIAALNGFLWETLWNHGNNAQLKDKRKDPDILLPGDILHIPDIQTKEESKPADARHKFRKKGTPAKLALKIMTFPKETKEFEEQPKNDPWKYSENEPPVVKPEPMGNTPYELYADGKLVASGNTDGDGMIKAGLPPAAESGYVILNKGTPEEKMLELNFRHMDPIDEVPGLCKRLINLGFPCPPEAKEVTPEVEAAIRAFQTREGLEVNGKYDDALKGKLKEIHGG